MANTLILTKIFLIIFFSTAGVQSENKMPEQPLKLYYLPASPSCRAVMMTAMAVGVDLELITIDHTNGNKLMTPEYLKLIPHHVLPTIEDNGFILWGSRAIMMYLVNSYAGSDSLYPNSPQQRALVDQRLNYDLGVLVPRYMSLYIPVLFRGEPYDEEKAARLDEALGSLNIFLDETSFVCGNDLTIADIAIIVTITNIDAFGYDFSAHGNVTKWFERTKKILEPYGYTEIDVTGSQILVPFIRKE